MGDGIRRGLQRLQEAAASLPDDERPTFAAPADERAIAALESADGQRCPTLFRELLLETAAIIGMDVRNGYSIGEPIGLARSIRRGDFPRVLHCGGWEERVLPIATDGGGNAFFLCHDVGQIWGWDHETEKERFVADDLCQFLLRVAEDWEHFAADDQEWSYLAWSGGGVVESG